ncbi:ABC-three component system middle component 6 [Vibrio sp. Vb1980]|uniref:ABC-three component system middle component 6 n=1 Tax=Vibrio sp. Vb1980 TaxID=3074646 RepID=UPI00398E67A0
MIISNSQSQKLSLIVIGANILAILSSEKNNNACPLSVFDLYIEKFNDITFTYFSYGLDWLFICGAIEIDNDGNIIKCN